MAIILIKVLPGKIATKFDSIDLFWLIPTVIEDWKINSHPHQFYAYYEMIKKTGPGNHGASIIDIVKNPFGITSPSDSSFEFAIGNDQP